MSDENEPVIVFSGSIMQADFLKAALEANGITVFLKDSIMAALAPYYVEPVGTVKVVIRRSDIEKAKPIVQRFLEKKDSKKQQHQM